MTSAAARQLSRVIRGAIKQTFDAHPDYIAHSRRYVVSSLEKRLVGAILGYVEQSTQVRSRAPKRADVQAGVPAILPASREDSRVSSRDRFYDAFAVVLLVALAAGLVLHG